MGATFEDAARNHAVRLVASGTLPPTTLVDEWWTTRGQPAQVDVLGLTPDHRTVAIGEAKWQQRPLGNHELDELAAKLRSVPDPVPQPTFLLYGRGGARPEMLSERVLGFDIGAMLDI